jgi:diguanylate cyclase (GGDEF)-like protein
MGAVPVPQMLRLLMVEDVAADAELAVRQLRGSGLDFVHQVVDAEPAFRAALGDFRPHVVVSDFTLPGFGGLAALDILVREAPEVPFIFFSGTLGEELAIEALRRGAIDYVFKSNPSRLAPAIQRAVREAAERRRHEEEIARLTRTLKMHSGINAAALRIRDRDELLREACRIAVEVGGYHRALIAVVEEDGRTASPLFRAGAEDEKDAPPDVYPIGDDSGEDTSIVARALRSGEIAVCNDLTQSQPPVAQREKLIALGYRSVVSLPLSVDGARVAALVLVSRELNVVRDEELLLLQEIMASLSLALQYREREDAVQYLAYFDPLTGLANRALYCRRLDDRLRAMRGPESSFAVVAFDVHNLSVVNDSFGRRIGDLLLEQLAERLKTQSDDEQRIGYLGGGTFAVVVPQLDASEDSIAQFLESAIFNDVFSVEGRTIRVSFRSGIARSGRDGEDGGTLVQKAEAALTEAKRSGETFMQYQVQMHSEIAERLAMEHRLRIALDEHQFELHYQPQIDVATGRIGGVEALLRWRDPERGIIVPGEFLPVLESSGLIVPVGRWVLEQAVHDCLRWRSAGAGPVRVSVNVSAIQVRRRAFVEQVLDAVARLPPDGYGVDVEITETGLLQDLETSRCKLQALREAGVRIAIDDFGTGYSSLALLPQLPVDLLKIDRSFIRGLPDDRASVTLVSSIIGLALAFDLTAVAEGVETAGQLEVLRALACHQSQGYLHSRPVPADEIERMLKNGAAGGRMSGITAPMAGSG